MQSLSDVLDAVKSQDCLDNTEWDPVSRATVVIHIRSVVITSITPLCKAIFGQGGRLPPPNILMLSERWLALFLGHEPSVAATRMLRPGRNDANGVGSQRPCWRR